ncbi:site-specific integrase [Novosphingobium sp. SG707]|uniref:tyrosine-type recombinase/integrase n=1 Tax=Novosphingobium sp. SG707 TaxID=2586996 RepID=UPI0014484A49|nr:site-specific integrase [Novosphingobium sp. SG707]NKJ02780.1 integrase [Novosphingobium sp. SG707]
MAKAPITKRTVDAAKPGPAEYVIWDDGGKETIKGFGLKVTPAGSKVYIFQYRLARAGLADKTAPRKYTIGKHGPLTPDQARTRAKELAAMVEQGIDPRQSELDAITAQDNAKREAAEKARLEGELAFERLAPTFLDWYENEKGRRPSSVAMARLVVNGYLLPKLTGRPLPHIARADLQPILDGIPTKKRGMRRAVFAYASIFFSWALKRGDIDENPLLAMAKPEAPKARDRVLADTELTAIWNASSTLSDPFGQFFRLLMLTGQRRSEVAGIAWSELDRASATWIIPADRAKNGVAHLVPLTSHVVEELDRLAMAAQMKADAKAEKAKATTQEPDPKRWPKSGPVLTTTGRTPISGITKAKNALDTAVAEARKEDGGAIPAWRIHDLRRTLATGFQRLGVRFEVTEAVLNHVSGAKAGVAGIYQRHDWAEEKRTALEAWARHVQAIVTPAEKTNVVPIRNAKQSAGSV